MKRILVTGANGYIGRHVVKQLLDFNYHVIACDFHLADIDDRADKIECNLFDISICDKLKQKGIPDICIHLAWRDGFIHNSQNHIYDLSSHYRFLTSLIDSGLKQLAILGTMHEIGYWEGEINEHTPCNPISLYGIAKDTLRKSIFNYATEKECVIQWLRAFYLLGDDLKNHSIFTKILLADAEGKKLFPFTQGKTKYDFITVNELAHQITKVISQKEVNGIINCCSGNPVTLAEKVEEFIKKNKLNIKLQYGAFPDRPYDSPIIYGDATKIKNILKK